MKKVLIILIVAGLVWGGFWYYKSRPQKMPDGQVEVTTYKPFFPFGKTTSVGTDSSTPIVDSNTTENNSSPEVADIMDNILNKTSRLHQITTFEVAGFSTFIDTRPIPVQTIQESAPLPTEDIPVKAPTATKKTVAEKKVTEVQAPPMPTTEQVPALRYIERSNGHIYGEYLDTMSSDKISDATIPMIYEAVWGNNGNSVIYRYLTTENKIQSFVATLGGQNGEFLPENVQAVSSSPYGNQFFYLAPLGNNIAGYVGSFSDSKKNQVFNSPFTEWLPQWVGKSTIFLTTKPSWDTEGSIYILNITNGSFNKVFGGVKGLTTLSSPLGVNILYSGINDGAMQFSMYDLKTNTSKKFDFVTLPEKCVWSSDNITIYCGVPDQISGSDYPDKWYQGRVSFDDKIIRIDTSTGDIENLLNKATFDITNPSLSSDEKMLLFINKKDSTLWALDIK